MKKKPGFKLLAMVCIFAILCSCGFSVLAEEPLTSLETVPPQYASDYFLNMHFTGTPSGKWSGGGLAVEKITGTWSAKAEYSADHDALSLGGMETTLDRPITNEGTYVLEIDLMAPDFAFAADENCRFDIVVNGTLYAARIFIGGSMDLAGKSKVFTMTPEEWYTVRFLMDLSSHTYKAQVINKATRTVEAEASNAFDLSEISKLRMWQRTAAEKPLYTQNWKFYKNDTGKVQTLDFIRPSDPAGYYINVDGATMDAWSSETTGTAGTWAGASNVYEQDNGWVKLAANQHFQANITKPAVSPAIGGKTAGLTEGAYVTEVDFRAELQEGDSGNLDVVTTGTVQKRSNNPQEPRNPVLVRVAADTGMITLFASDAGTSVNTNQAAEPGTWYTAKALMDLTNQTLTVEVQERGTGAVIARGSSEMPDWLLLTTVLRSQNKAQNATLYTQNFKFYPKSEPSNVPPAVFQDTNGLELTKLPSSGTVAVVPALLKKSGGVMDCVYTAALYKKTEQDQKILVEAQTRAYSVSGDSPVIWSPNKPVSFEIPNDGEDYLIKCYVWDSFEEMKPLTETAELD